MDSYLSFGIIQYLINVNVNLKNYFSKINSKNDNLFYLRLLNFSDSFDDNVFTKN
jgi:hypothetical protein